MKPLATKPGPRMYSLGGRDLTHVLDHTRDVWADLRGARVIVTGASGFVGSWLLETLVHADAVLGLGVDAIALVRDREAFAQRLPHLAASRAIRVETADLRLSDPPVRAFTHVMHCASAAGPYANSQHPGEVVDLIERGTERMVRAAQACGGVRFLQISSGSVYGPQAPSVARVDEQFPAAADSRVAAQRFGAAKRRAEERGEAAVSRGVAFVSARIFALIGPRLPHNGPFAIGNFLGDALAGRPVRLTGDGSPVRSWMHTADMAAWSWTLLVRGTPGAAYNVGSEEEHTLWDAARRVATLPSPPVETVRAAALDPVAPTSRYVPSIQRARGEFGLEAWIPFEDALQRTWDWLRTENRTAA